jgi:hypothetical protein
MNTVDQQNTGNTGGIPSDLATQPIDDSPALNPPNAPSSALDLNNPGCVSLSSSAPEGTNQPSNDSTPPDSALNSEPSSLNCLKQLPKEPHAAFSAFFLYATARPTPSISAFAREHSFNRNTINNWRELYRWKQRLSAFNAARAERFVDATDKQVPPPTIPASPPSTACIDFRAETLRLARRAIDTWLSENETPVTLQGLTRILELASKFNPPVPVGDFSEQAAYCEYLERIRKGCENLAPTPEQGEFVQNGSTPENANP